MRQLGRAMTIIARAMAREIAFHEDVSAFDAPSECHESVSRGEAKRMREARRHARSVTGLTRGKFNRVVAQLHPRHMDQLVGITLDKISPHY